MAVAAAAGAAAAAAAVAAALVSIGVEVVALTMTARPGVVVAWQETAVVVVAVVPEVQANQDGTHCDTDEQCLHGEPDAASLQLRA